MAGEGVGVAAQEEDGSGGEAGEEAEPDAEGIEVQGIGEEPGGGEADGPVADEGDVEAALGVVEAAQESDADVLGAVEELRKVVTIRRWVAMVSAWAEPEFRKGARISSGIVR